jgi:hypothetical protein
LPSACPPGTYLPNYGAVYIGECTQCMPGYFCNETGLPQPAGICPPGYYCPVGTVNATDFSCPTGYMCAGTYEPVPCPRGTFQNETAAFMCNDCPAGQYCEKIATVYPVDCPPGFYCPVRSHLPSACAPGTVQPLLRASNISECETCPKGSYCSDYSASASLPCAQGFLCEPGSLTGQGAQTTDKSDNLVCPVGYVCATGVPSALPCPSGWYQPRTGAHSFSMQCMRCPPGTTCANNATSVPDPCPAGYWCDDTDSLLDVAQQICPSGAYCGAGAASPIWCESGTYQLWPGATSSNACTPCPSGSFCPFSSSTFFDCPAGSYCPAGSSIGVENMCPPGTFNPTANASALANCSSCPQSQYCSGPGLLSPSGQCSEGYLCGLGEITSAPEGRLCAQNTICTSGAQAATTCPFGYICNGTSFSVCPDGQQCKNSTAAPCPAGHYCVEGSVLPCPPGTAPLLDGIPRLAACWSCPKGYICPLGGAAAPSICPPGFVCGEGETQGVVACPIGYYCPAGTFDPQPCPPGTLTNSTGRATCDQCPSGSFCDLEGQKGCPQGFWCGAGMPTPFKHTCPIGTYGQSGDLVSIVQCTDCPAGFVCDEAGATQVVTQCPEGAICTHAATTLSALMCSSNRSLLQPALQCAPGFYCPPGSSAMQPCPPGTSLNSSLGRSLADCAPCAPGYICPNASTAVAQALCLAGYYCTGGNMDGMESQCPAGWVCAEGSIAPQLCPIGTYTATSGTSICDPCPAGYVCDSSLSTTPYACPAGSYCPVGTGASLQYLCPPGTFSNISGLTSESDCTPCSDGMYCDDYGMIAVRGPCMAGFVCSGGNSTPSDVRAACPAGHYCPEGSSTPTPCPADQFSDSTGNEHVSDCVTCPPGTYCNTTGLIEPQMNCSAGYYCPNSSAMLTCPVGHFCPESSASPTLCPTGTFALSTGHTVCDSCPAGFYCLLGTVAPVACDQGYYCESDSASPYVYPCPAGSYGSTSQLAAAAECELCPAGYVCDEAGLTAAASPCPDGAICVQGATTLSALLCFDAPLVGLAYQCSPGHYCPLGSSKTQPCPTGTSLNSTLGRTIQDCTPCAPGYICPQTSTAIPKVLCPAGYYCTGGNINGTESPCPAGWVCAIGSTTPQQCPEGTFTSSPGASTCDPCPAGYVCDLSLDTTPYPCPAGSYCPTGTVAPLQYLCPPGTFSNTSGLSTLSDCKPCTPGMYCDLYGMTEVRGPCLAGFTCAGGNATPSDLSAACPAGRYCPEGSSESIPCPAGFYSGFMGNANVTDCVICPAGMYCGQTGLTTPGLPCPDGQYCTAGSTSPQPCPVGYYCTQGIITTQKCQAGYYQSAENSSSCDQCNVGHLCTFGSLQPTNCPVGSYCDTASRSVARWTPCPLGTYSQSGNLSSPAECLACPAGFVCNYVGTILPVTACTSGFMCNGTLNYSNVGACGYARDDPDTSVNWCPKGFYCPAGTDSPKSCPVGLTTLQHGAVGIENCTSCAPGFECDGQAPPVRQICPAGWFCAGESFLKQLCPIGGVCTTGSTAPVMCPAGRFSNESGLSTCYECEPGMFCVGIGQPVDCHVGSYCPAGSQLPIPCPLGSFSNSSNAKSLGDCTLCPNGTLCTGVGLPSNNLICPMGYFCAEGTSALTELQPCPAGSFCTEGTSMNQLCPVGTYSPSEQVPDQSFCLPCPSQSECTLPGTVLGNATSCSSGYYCDGIHLPAVCPAGSVCPRGADHPFRCPHGTYTNSSGAAACQTCPPGKVCVSWSNAQENCAPGYYCALGSEGPAPCTSGFYAPSAGTQSANECSPCPAGAFCASNAMAAPSGLCGPFSYCTQGPISMRASGNTCAAGHICTMGAINTVGDMQIYVNASYYHCNPGTYCPADSAVSLLCPFGTYSLNNASSNCTLCPAGHVCDIGSPAPALCPPNFYCPGQLRQPVLCPAGRFSDQNTTFTSASDCKICSAGHYCLDGRIAGQCLEGFVCGTGSSTSTPSDRIALLTFNSTDNVTTILQSGQCPPGYYCGVRHHCPKRVPSRSLPSVSWCHGCN